MRAMEGNRLSWVEVDRDRNSGDRDVTFVTQRPHLPLRPAAAQMFAHVTRGFRRGRFPEENL